MSNSVRVPQAVRAAYVRREHGVQGEVAAVPLGSDARRFGSGLQLIDEASGAQYRVINAKGGASGDVILALDGVSSREEAQALRGKYLCVGPDSVRTLETDEWFVWQLVGLKVVDTNGAVIGAVSGVEEQSAHDLLVVDSPAGQQLFPMVSAFVQSVDLDAGQVVVTPWEWADEDDS